MPLPTPVFDTAPEPFATHYGETECDLTTARPGVEAFREFVLRQLGGGKGNIGRPCGATGHPSGHYSMRAWDWTTSADDPEQAARAHELLDWLLANDAEMFRRAGLLYVIWDKHKWTAARRKWETYDGWAEDGSCPTAPCRHPHRDHVHFSFGKEGADGLTSLYPWLADGAPKPPIDAPPTPNPYIPLSRPSPVPLVAGALLGAAATVTLARHFLPRR